MGWIVIAAVVNTFWTLWCVSQLPPRVASHFGLGGKADGWMSRKGFALFGILFPLAMAAFLMFVGRSDSGLEVAMQRLAAGLILFFSGISWSIVRSNRRTPARMDYPSLLLCVALLIAFTSLTVRDLPKHRNSPPSTTAASQG